MATRKTTSRKTTSRKRTPELDLNDPAVLRALLKAAKESEGSEAESEDAVKIGKVTVAIVPGMKRDADGNITRKRNIPRLASGESAIGRDIRNQNTGNRYDLYYANGDGGEVSESKGRLQKIADTVCTIGGIHGIDVGPIVACIESIMDEMEEYTS